MFAAWRAGLTRSASRNRYSLLFWGLVAALSLGRWLATSDLPILVVHAPHDDGLYVSRAFHLLLGNALGPYDARLLVKLPGMSIALAANRAAGFPYLAALNGLYILSGLYLVLAMRRCGLPLWALFVAFVVYLLNPVALSEEWFRPLREPLSASLMVLFFGAMLFILRGLQEQRLGLLHLVLFSAVFGFALLLREEEKLLYAPVLLLAVAVVSIAWRTDHTRSPKIWVHALAVMALPLTVAMIGNIATRSFVEAHYGLPIIHDFAEGEFPKFVAAMRAVESSKDNRYVMITQEALSRIRVEVPLLEPVISRVPAPSADSYSCHRYGVCSEWANGWMLFWIKDAAFRAGLTPSLPAAQAFFRDARLGLEKACSEGRLKCRDKGTGLLPPFELRWIRAYVQEWFTLLGMTLAPDVQTPEVASDNQAPDANYRRIYEIVLRAAEFDTSRQAVRLGADSATRNVPSFSRWQARTVEFYQSYGPILIFAGIIAFFVRVTLRRRLPLDVFACFAAISLVYAVVRLSALAYVALYFGHFDARIVFSTYVLIMLIAPLLIADAWISLLKYRALGARAA